ncbi:MAG: hypothetical protein OXC72_13435, partial [Roseovarius sp.]|nr:hypothetical protein [Roseovarius sp.]
RSTSCGATCRDLPIFHRFPANLAEFGPELPEIRGTAGKMPQTLEFAFPLPHSTWQMLFFPP